MVRGPHAKGHLPSRVERDGSSFQTLSSACPSCPTVRPAAAAFPNWPGRLVRALASLGQVTRDALVRVSSQTPEREQGICLQRESSQDRARALSDQKS